MGDNIDFKIRSSSKKIKKYITQTNDKTRLKIGNHKFIDLGISVRKIFISRYVQKILLNQSLARFRYAQRLVPRFHLKLLAYNLSETAANAAERSEIAPAIDVILLLRCPNNNQIQRAYQHHIL